MEQRELLDLYLAINEHQGVCRLSEYCKVFNKLRAGCSEQRGRRGGGKVCHSSPLVVITNSHLVNPMWLFDKSDAIFYIHLVKSRCSLHSFGKSEVFVLTFFFYRVTTYTILQSTPSTTHSPLNGSSAR